MSPAAGANVRHQPDRRCPTHRCGVRQGWGEGRAALVPYIVAGYPDADTSFRIALAAADAGADLLEIGLPYSDPLADGATLQRASQVALGGRGDVRRVIELIERVAAARPDVPLVPMAYANQVIGGGDGSETARRLAAAGASGMIVADLTPDEGGPFEAVAREAELAVVYLVAPTTEPERRARIAARTGGFLYCVSLVGVTGARTTLPRTVGRLVRDVRAVSPVPVAVGFGVSRPAHVRALVACGSRRGDRGLGARRRARLRRPGRGGPRPAGRGAPGRDPPALSPGRPPARAGAILRPMAHLETAEEVGPRKTFRWAVDWPGWARGGKDPDLARDAFIASAPRYELVAAQAGEAFPAAIAADDLDLVESVSGGSGTDFGVPSVVVRVRPPARRVRGGRAAGPARRGGLDRVRAGRRGGAGRAPQGTARRRARHGQDRRPRRRRRIMATPASWAFACPSRRPTDRAAIATERAAMLELLRQPSDGTPIAGRRWTARYAARRIAWHALDHAWEIEDRTERRQ